jgi:hypothetical protein
VEQLASNRRARAQMSTARLRGRWAGWRGCIGSVT